MPMHCEKHFKTMSSNSSEKPVYFKVSMIDLEGNQNEKRRFSLDRNSSTEFSTFKKKLLTYFPALKKGQDVKVFYCDSEGDNITVSSSDELNLAIEQSDDLCKFEVRLVAAPSNENKLLHKGIKCNDCKKEIQGDRFKCIMCPDYDCCSECEKAAPHNHVMLKIIEPIKTMESLLPCFCKLLKAFFDDQKCNHKDCTTCHIRRSCSHSWRDGTISQEYMGVIKAIDSGLGKCPKCAPNGNINSVITSPTKVELKTNVTSPSPKITKPPTPPATNGVNPTFDLSKTLRPTLNQPRFQVPMVRVVRPSIVMQPVCPTGMQSVVYTRGPPLQYTHPYQAMPVAPPNMMYNPMIHHPMPQHCPYPRPPPAPYCPAPPIPQMNVHSANMQAMNGNSVHSHMVNGNQANGHMVNGNQANGHIVNGHSASVQVANGYPVDDHLVNGGSVITHSMNGNSVSSQIVNGLPGIGHQLVDHPKSIPTSPLPTEMAYDDPYDLFDDPTVSTPTSSGTSSQDNSLTDEDQVKLQRAILKLSARGYAGEIKGLEDVLRSVNLDVEKACIMLNLN